MPFLLHAASAIVALLILMAVLPGKHPWSVEAYRDASSLWAGLSMIFIVAAWVIRRGRIGREGASRATSLDRWSSLILPPLVAAVLLVALRFRRLEDPPMGAGDSLHLSEFIPVAARLFGFVATPDELLELFLRSRLFLSFDGVLPSAVSLGLYSYVAAVVLAGGVFWFLRSVPHRSRILAWLVLFFTPQMALFAGYIESYSMAVALISVIVLGGWRLMDQRDVIVQRRMLRVLAALAGVAALHHMIAGFLLPALVFLAWRVSRGSMSAFLREALVCGGIGGGILAGGFVLFRLSPQGPMIFADSHAGTESLLSFSGVLAGSNIGKVGAFFFLFPLPLAWALARSWQRLRRVAPSPVSGEERAVSAFLWAAFLPFFLHALIWKSTIGFPADWDLFSIFMGPLHILILHDLLGSADGVRSVSVSHRAEMLAVAALTALPAFFWMLWLHQETSATRANRSYIESLHESVIPALQADAELPSLPPVRKKAYVRVALFTRRVRFLLEHVAVTDDERAGIVSAIDRGDAVYRGALHAPEAEYDAAFATAQQDFFRAYQLLRGRAVHP